MPELPEVETVRRRLEERVRGREICEVEVHCSRLRSPVPPGLTALLSDAQVYAVGRKGKYLLIHLKSRNVACASWHVRAFSFRPTSERQRRKA